MNNQHHSEDVTTDNEKSLETLVRSLQLSQGQFSLILLRCNYADVRERMVQRLHNLSPVPIKEIHLPASIKTLYTTIVAELGNEQPLALMVFGLESVKDLNTVLTSANQVREEFRKNFPFPMLLWINDQVLQQLIRLAPDLETWTTTVEFAIATDELLQLIQRSAEEVFTKVLEAGAGKFLDNTALNLAIGSPQRVELESAQQELQNRGVNLDAEIEASLEFVLGRDAGSMGQSRQHYERSLELWQQISKLEQKGCVLHSLGLWWRTYAVQHLAEQIPACIKAKDYYQQCIQVFEQANRRDLVAKFINALGEVLQKLEQWNELECIAQKALTLYENYPDWFRSARAFGFLAEVALHKGAWEEAKEAAEQALAIVANARADATSANLDWVRQYHQGWYLFALARAQQHLNQEQAAIQTLETAKAETKPQYDPELYIQILCELRDIYFKQSKYLIAFEFKQEQRSIEQQYGFRAFVGAGRLYPKQQIINPSLAVIEQQETVTEEISASGRQQDVNRLVERMGRDDHKLTVIYGQSGVGKSSIVQAGLIPALQSKPIGSRDIFPILLQVYTDWIQELGQCIGQNLEEMRGILLDKTLDSTTTIVEQLQHNDERNFLSVLIFDQFEEFFFINKETKQRLPFYEFFRDCLNTPYVKVILSLREDYLHYLLEFNRLTMLEVINNNILDKLVLYYLGNFTPEDTKSVIQKLTSKTQLFLEPSLIDELVKDLAGEIGEVRPIELQVVGAQLQTDKITTLEQYQQNGPKEKLVGKFLEEVVQDCGANHEQIAKLVLYLLTDENNTRPLKTRADLELELEVKAETLDLVLEILVKSGIVLRVPAFPKERYQLVHDYLVPFVRQKQSARFIEELEKEREQRKLTERRLIQVQQRQLQAAQRARNTLVGLVGAIGTFAAAVTIVGINLYLTNLSSLSLSDGRQLPGLVSSLRAGKWLKQLSLAAIPETQLRVVMHLMSTVYGVRELNSLEGHTRSINKIRFSPDGKILASVSEDNIIKLWRIDGTFVETLSEHKGSITSIRFSPNSKILASGGKDKTVKIWKSDGTLVATLLGHQDNITDINFSSNSKLLASTSEDKTVRVWRSNGTRIRTLSGYIGSSTGVSFSPDSKMLAWADKDGIVHIWKLDGKKKEIHSKEGSIATVIFSFDNKAIILLNTDSKLIKVYDINGNVIRDINKYNEDINKISKSYQTEANKHLVVSELYSKVYNTANTTYSSVLGNHQDSITDTSSSSSAKVVASAGKDKTVKLWSAQGKEYKQDEEHRISLDRSLFSPDGKTIAAADYYNKVQIWNKDGNLLKSFQGDGSTLSFNPNSRTIATGSGEDVIKLWRFGGKEITLEEPNSRIESVQFSPDGEIIASVCADNTVQLWNRDGTFRKKLDGHNNRITNIIFSPNSQMIVSTDANNVLKFWKSDGTFINTLPRHSGKIKSIEFSPDSQIIVSTDTNQIVKLWNLDGVLVTTLTGSTDHRVTNLIFSPDSQMLASTDAENTVKLWNRDGTFIKTLTTNMVSLNKVKFSPDSQMILASVNYGKRKALTLWHRDGTFIKTIKENYLIEEIVFSRDSSMVAFIYVDGRVKIQRLSDGQSRIFIYQDSISMDNWFSPDGDTIIFTQDNVVNVWRFSDSKQLDPIRAHSSKIQDINFSPDGQTIAFIVEDNIIELWSRNGKKIGILKHEGFNRLIFSSDSKTIASYGKDNTIKFWRSNDGHILKIINGNFRKRFNRFEDPEMQSSSSEEKLDLSFSSNGKTVAYIQKNHALKLWNLNGTLIATLKGHTATINSASFSPDGTIIASASDDATVKLWTNGGVLLHTLKHNASVNSVSFSPDGKIIASASHDQTVKLWTSNGTLLRILKHDALVNSVNFSPDGKIIASASHDETVQLWNSNGTPRQQKLEHNNTVTSFSFSSDNNTIVSVTDDKTLKIWRSNGKDWKEFKTVSSLSYRNDGESSVRFNFSPNSKILAYISTESSYMSFEILDGIWLKDPQFFLGVVPHDLSFSPDGKTIAVASNSGLLLLSLELDKLMKRGCNWVHNYLQNNSKLQEGDRQLCDEFTKKEDKPQR